MESRGFVTDYTRARHFSLSSARPIHSLHAFPSHLLNIHVSLFSQLRLALPSPLFPLDLPTKTLYVTLLSTISATCPTHLVILDLINRVLFHEEYSL
jgi:hypothetical protein